MNIHPGHLFTQDHEYPSRTFGYLGPGISISDIQLPRTMTYPFQTFVTWNQKYPSRTFGYLGPGISILDIVLPGPGHNHPGHLVTQDHEKLIQDIWLPRTSTYPFRTFGYQGPGISIPNNWLPGTRNIHPGHLVSWDQKYPPRTFVYLGPGHIHPGHNHDERKYELKKSKNREYTLHG